MKFAALPLALALGLPSLAAQAQVAYEGTIDYTAAATAAGDEDVVGPFDSFDFSRGVVLIQSADGTNVNYNGYFQSYVTSHLLGGDLVFAPGLNSNYEVTVVANFTETRDPVSGEFIVTGGTAELWFDTNVDRSFSGDSGFDNAQRILSATIVGGFGDLNPAPAGSSATGFTELNLRVDSFDAALFEPDTIASGDSVFTLRYNSRFDASFLNSISAVQGNAYNAANGDFLFAADGYLALAVPEPESYAMLLAGLGMLGMVARRRMNRR